MKKIPIEKVILYWDDIPLGKHNAVTYQQLMKKWDVSKRSTREILSALACFDNGTDEVLIRTSHSSGFYKTADIKEIEEFRAETLSRGLACLAPLKKINRVLKKSYENTGDLLELLSKEI